MNFKKLSIRNRTRYRTRHLRMFVVRAYRTAASLSGPARVANWERWAVLRSYPLTITFARSNRRGMTGTTGHAYLNSHYAHVGVGDMVNKVELARTIAHEIAHCFGLHHADMDGGALMGGTTSAFDWARDLPLDRIGPKARPTLAERRTQRLDRIETRLAAWRTKRKRAESAIRKLSMQKARLGRLATAATPGKVAPASRSVLQRTRDEQVHAQADQPDAGKADA